MMNTAENFLKQMMQSANQHDLVEHMNLISKQVVVYGVPDFEVITYDDWYKQCQYEFANKLLKQVSYQGLKILVETENNIMFKTIETVIASDETNNSYGVEFVIKKESDDNWRVAQQRILPADELANDRAKGNL